MHLLISIGNGTAGILRLPRRAFICGGRAQRTSQSLYDYWGDALESASQDDLVSKLKRFFGFILKTSPLTISWTVVQRPAKTALQPLAPS